MTPEALADTRAQFVELLAAGERRAAMQRGVALLETGVALADFVLDVLAPAQVEASLLAAKRGQGHERVAADVADLLLIVAAGRRAPSDDKPRLVLCAADRDHHNLPPRMIAELLRAEGHHVTFLGAPTPHPGLVDTFRDMRPDAVVVSCSLDINLPVVPPLVEAVHEAGLPVIGGGRAFDGQVPRASRLGADGHAGRIAEVTRSVVDASGAPGGVRDELAVLQQSDLAAVRGPLAEELADRVGYRLRHLIPRDMRSPRRLREDLGILLRHVEAALACGDPEVFARHRAWLEERQDAAGGDPLFVAEMLAMVRERLAPDLPATEAILDRSLAA